MPTQRLPWFKFWIGATSNGKVRTLDDGTFRTWIELLDAAAQQPKRGRFASRAEAIAITRRPAKHVAALIDARLIDESTEGLTMHDWDDWQRWRKEDTNDAGSPPEPPGSDTRSTIDQHTNGSVPLREKKKERVEGRGVIGEVDERVSPSGSLRSPSPPGGRQRRVTVADEEFMSQLREEFAEAYGSRTHVAEEIAAAMSHKARLKYSDERAYLRNWLRRGVPRGRAPALSIVSGESAYRMADCVHCGKASWTSPCGECLKKRGTA